MIKPKLILVLFFASMNVLAQNNNVKPPAISFVAKLPDVLKETSALLYWNNGLWTLNDSGNTPFLFKIDTLTGAILRSVWIKNANNADWECMAQDENYIYIGDTGDNLLRRVRKKIYIVPKALLADEAVKSVLADTISFELPERREGRLKVDIEAMVYANGMLHLFSKETDTTRRFTLPANGGRYFTAKYEDEMVLDGRVTDACYDSVSRKLLLLTSVPFGLRYLYRISTDGAKLLKGKTEKFVLGNLLQCGQMEGMYPSGNQVYFTNELFQAFAQSLWKWKMPK